MARLSLIANISFHPQTETLLQRGLVFPTNLQLRNTAQLEIGSAQKAVEGLDAVTALCRKTFDNAFVSLKLLVDSEVRHAVGMGNPAPSSCLIQTALESVVRGLADHSAHTRASANILSMWEELTELEALQVETYNVARALLDNAYTIWDLVGTTNRDRREIVERMQDSHKTLSDQIVPIARICQDIKVCVPQYAFNTPNTNHVYRRPSSG